LLSTGWFQERI